MENMVYGSPDAAARAVGASEQDVRRIKEWYISDLADGHFDGSYSVTVRIDGMLREAIITPYFDTFHGALSGWKVEW